MRSIKRFTSLILVFVMAVSMGNVNVVTAATAKGTTLRLEATEGTVTLKNAQGTAKSIKEGMKLYNGDTASTAASSYAYISMDATKAVKVEENSSVSIKQNGTQNEVMISEGSLLFNVTVPLKKTESLNIRTSTMVTGVRGTIGVGKRISDDESILYLLEGHTEIVTIDRKTRNLNLVPLSAGQCATITRENAKASEDDQVIEATIESITEESMDDFVIIEIGRNLDVQKRLREGDVFDVDKILKLYEKLGDNGTYITIGEVVTPNSVSGNKSVSGNAVTPNAVTPNTVTPNTAGGGGGGGGGGAGGGGGNAGGNAKNQNPAKLQNKTITSAPAVADNSVTAFSQIIVPEVTTCKLYGSDAYNDAIPAGDTVEYAVSLTEEAPQEDDKWQVSNTFTGLKPATKYYFFSRIKATETTEASAPSAPVEMTTKGAEPVVVHNENGDIYFELSTGNSVVSPDAVTASCGSPLSFYNAGKGVFDNIPDPSDYSSGLTIPATVECYGENVPVTAVMGAGFNSSNKAMESITIPDTVETIGEYAFNGAVVTGNVAIGKNVKKIDRMAFQNCSAASVEFKGGVETIGEEAFKGCANITSVDIPDGLKTLKAGAFQDCLALRKVYLPGSLETVEVTGSMGVDSLPFEGCYYNANMKEKATIYFNNDEVPAGFGENWKVIDNTDPNNTVAADVYYFKEDDTDDKTVSLYSPECNAGVYNAATFGYESYTECNSLNDMTQKLDYRDYIDVSCLSWALTEYDKVVIPEGNIAILSNIGEEPNVELEIRTGKTLVVNGEMSTTEGAYIDDGNGYYDPTETDGSGGNITNHGNIIVGSAGKLYTSDSNIFHGNNAFRNGTIISDGSIQVSGVMHVFNTGIMRAPVANDGDICLSVEALKLEKTEETTGTLYLYNDAAMVCYDYDSGQMSVDGLGLKYENPEGYKYTLTSVGETKEFKIKSDFDDTYLLLSYECYIVEDSVNKKFEFFIQN